MGDGTTSLIGTKRICGRALSFIISSVAIAMALFQSLSRRVLPLAVSLSYFGSIAASLSQLLAGDSAARK